ncbi:MAG: amine dehydrogenase [Proteobacteria bacterium]|nr:amine dehydrogenase [Pseudomonadota bacterium]
MRKVMLLFLGATCAFADTGASRYANPLPSDSDLKVLTLPETYPRTWAYLAYANDKFEIRDVGTDSRAVIGQLPGHESATLLAGTHRPELYVADTVWARGNRGARTDYITIYDKRTLSPVGEVVLPGAKRALIVPLQGMMSFADDERLALIYNFTPAASVTIVDLVARKVLNEVKIPGCSLAYSTGPRGFASLCSSGTVLSVQLDAKGAVKSRQESTAFNNLDNDPMFTASAEIKGVRYFPTFLGRMQPIDFTGNAANVLPAWSLVTEEDRKENWRPSGMQVVGAGDDGRLYVIMQRDGHEGSHKEPGTEVWVFDSRSHARIDRLRLVRPGWSVEVTHTPTPELLVATSDQLDVYGLPHGNLVRSLDASAHRGGLMMEAVK